jgi:hypothetical protein
MVDVKRALIVSPIPKSGLAASLAGEGDAVFELGGSTTNYSSDEGWYLVSHTFELLDDGSGLLSMIYEKRN